QFASYPDELINGRLAFQPPKWKVFRQKTTGTQAYSPAPRSASTGQRYVLRDFLRGGGQWRGGRWSSGRIGWSMRPRRNRWPAGRIGLRMQPRRARSLFACSKG